MGRRRDYDNEPDDADELIAEDRARRRICRHRSGDPDCDCHDEPEDEEAEEG